MNTISTKINKETLLLIEKEKASLLINNNEYLIYRTLFNDVNINIYKSKKDDVFTLVASSKNSESINNFLKKFNINYTDNNFIFTDSQIGSDEVGTGDFFGPIVVASSYVNKEIYLDIIKYKINDSKKLKDKDILKIIPIFIEKYPNIFKHLILSNERFNNATKLGYNLNEIKALMHNKCLYNLNLKFKECNNIYVDEFVNEGKYYAYLKKANIKNIEKNIIFHTKGETYFPCVALASCYARFLFLKEIEKLNKKYNIVFPLGASSKVDLFIKEFIDKYGLKELSLVGKISYKNLSKVNK